MNSWIRRVAGDLRSSKGKGGGEEGGGGVIAMRDVTLIESLGFFLLARRSVGLQRALQLAGSRASHQVNVHDITDFVVFCSSPEMCIPETYHESRD